MSGKLIIFFTVFLAVYICTECEASGDCNRPKDSFDNPKRLHDYLECIKSQVLSTTRYGKRAPPALIGKLRPDLYDYDFLQQIQDMLYADN